ncbi:MAG TPA: HNH endonuclease signature motif containing protein, partial [Acidimicrobiales bacterium]
GTTADTAPATNGTNSSTPVVSDSDGWSFAKVIVRADLAALDRGHTEPGELCEIAGQGPIPVADAWKIIDGGAFVAGIVTDGTDVSKVRHLGRRPTVLQRTVLEWETAGTCAVEGCTNAVRTEIDHTEPWATTQVTQIGDLAALCKSCHAKKTYEGFTLGPRLPNGKRQLIPPGHPAPPGEQGAQSGLFDTG